MAKCDTIMFVVSLYNFVKVTKYVSNCKKKKIE